MTTLYECVSYYKKLGIGTTPSSAPTITIIDSANNILVAALTATTALSNLPGAFRYSYSGADGLILYYVFHTSDATMDEQDIGGIPNINPVIRDIQTRIPAALTANGNMKSSLMEIIANALSEDSAGYLAAAFKKLFNIAAPTLTAADVNQTGDSFGLIGTAGVGLTNLGDARLAHLNADITSRMATFTYTAPDNASIATILTDVATILADYARRTGDYNTVAPDNADIAAIKADIENVTFGLNALLTAINGISAGDSAAVWNYLLTSILTSGSIGKLIKDNLDAKISSRSTPNSPVTIPPATLVSGSSIAVLRGDSMALAFTGLGSLANLSKLYFTVKSNPADGDDNSIMQIEKTAGLVVINRAPAPTPADGVLTVTDSVLGNITVSLIPGDTALLPSGACLYDVEIVRTDNTVSTLTAGSFTVLSDVTRKTT